MIGSLLEQLRPELSASYDIRREIGGGGMSHVFLAEEKALGRLVAIKVLSPSLAAGISAERFTREVRLASQLQQINIVPVFSTGIVAGLPYYTMPFVNGRSLREMMSGGAPIPMSEAVHILTDVARALAFAHEQGIAHRDIKPENVLISGDSAVVTDFGIAKAMSESTEAGARTTLTEAGTAIGTPAYMSPEQASGDSVDARTDIYSWGVLAFELLSGAHPFAGHSTAAALVRAHIAETPAALGVLRPELPGQLSATVMRCLEKNPAARPENGREILRLLTGATGAEGIAASRSPAGGMRRVAAVAAALAVTALVAWGWFKSSRDSAGAGAPPAVGSANRSQTALKSVAVLPFANVGGDPREEYFSDGVTDEIADALSRIPGIRLASRTSSFAFKAGGALDAREIGKRLNVGSLLEGQVMRAGNRLRVSAQLTDVATGLELWRNKYEREQKDVFAVQAEIARSIASALRVAMADTGKVAAPTANLAAHDLYLRGRYEQAKYTRANLRRAITLYDSALALDPQYADAYASTALTWFNLSDDWISPATAIPKVRAAAEQALRLDPSNARAQIALFFVGEKTGDPAATRAQAEKAVSLAGNDPDALAYIALGLAPADLKNALRISQIAALMDTTNSTALGIHATMLFFAGREGEALGIFDRMRRDGVSVPMAELTRGDVLMALKRPKEALESYRGAAQNLSDGGRMGMAKAHVALGERARAVELLRALEGDAAHRYVSRDYIAQVYLALGDKESALKNLERAQADRSSSFNFLGLNPVWAPLRGEPRFEALRRGSVKGKR